MSNLLNSKSTKQTFHEWNNLLAIDFLMKIISNYIIVLITQASDLRNL